MDNNETTCAFFPYANAEKSSFNHFPTLRDVSDEVISTLTQNIEKDGFCVIPNYIGATDLTHLQDFVENRVKDVGGGYLGLVGKSAFQGTMLNAIADSAAFLNLIYRVYEKGHGHLPPKQTLHQVLRCLSGKSGQKHAYYFHYDSYVVTALLPIIIPNCLHAGHFIMIPNIRKIRKSYARNVFYKILLENNFIQRLLRLAYGAKRLGFMQLQITPGNLYLFWGYRSLHANEACDPDQIRATALYHFGDPHAESSFRRFLGKTKTKSTQKKYSDQNGLK